MRASPLVPGRAYRVCCQQQAFVVLATNPCEAIVIALDVFGALA